jgi:hypothetical protein
MGEIEAPASDSHRCDCCPRGSPRDKRRGSGSRKRGRTAGSRSVIGRPVRRADTDRERTASTRGREGTTTPPPSRGQARPRPSPEANGCLPSCSLHVVDVWSAVQAGQRCVGTGRSQYARGSPVAVPGPVARSHCGRSGTPRRRAHDRLARDPRRCHRRGRRALPTPAPLTASSRARRLFHTVSPSLRRRQRTPLTAGWRSR